MTVLCRLLAISAAARLRVPVSIMKKLLLTLLWLTLAICAGAEEISVAAAADLNFALKDLAARYEQKSGNHVSLSFGASGNFYSQIRSGAPFDLYFSADIDYPRKLA